MSSVKEVNNKKSAGMEGFAASGGGGVKEQSIEELKRSDRLKAKAVKGQATESEDTSSRNGSPNPDQANTPEEGGEGRRGRATTASRIGTRVASRSRSAGTADDKGKLAMGREKPRGEAEKAAKKRGDTGKARSATHHSRMGKSEEIREGSGGEDGQGDGTFMDEDYSGIYATVPEDRNDPGKVQPVLGMAEGEKAGRRGIRGMLATSSESDEHARKLEANNKAALGIQPRVREFANTPNGRKLAGRSLDGEKGQAPEDQEGEEAGGATPASEPSGDSASDILFSNQQQQQQADKERRAKYGKSIGTGGVTG
jgi:hypothetical protein